MRRFNECDLHERDGVNLDKIQLTAKPGQKRYNERTAAHTHNQASERTKRKARRKQNEKEKS